MKKETQRLIVGILAVALIISLLLPAITIGFNNAVLAEASMSYLGIGVGPADASLGRMLSEAQGYLLTASWCTLFPALVVILLILGVGMIGEGVRERMGERE